MMKRKKGLQSVIFLICCAFLIALDQYTKYLASAHLQTGPFVILEGIFEFHYTINRGAAFGIFQNQIVYFLIVTVLLLFLIGYTLWKMPSEKKYRPMRGILIILTAGALGNMIDRLFLGYVIDFLYFKLINFPIFNVADCYVCIAAFLFFFAMMFYYKDGDFAFLIPARRSRKDDCK
ncbi:MAG: signal peptidase II [Lachnospiraceae bacterium]|nr:signal peptidase II [Lachnospiraceae bacterium]